MAKARVHELAKELGVPSKLVLETLKDMGEFVKSASSTVEAPVVRKLTDQYGDTLRAQAKPAKKAAAKKAATPEPEAPAAATVTAPPEVEIAHGGPATQEPAHPSGAEQFAPTPQPQLTSETPAASASPEAPTRPAAPRPSATPRPPARPGTPRPGNNPFSSTQGMRRPGPAGRAPTGRDGVPDRGSDMPGGMPRPNPAMMPQQGSSGLTGRGAPGTDRGRPGGRPGAPGRGPSGGRFGGRPGPGRAGRGGTQGAFGRPGGPSRRGRKSKRAKRQEFDNMQAPVTGGVRVRTGDGETVRLARGASLTDFAEKIDADPASLVQLLWYRIRTQPSVFVNSHLFINGHIHLQKLPLE